MLDSPQTSNAFEPTGPSTLEVAALSVLEASASAADLSALVAERALHHCWEGLRQYLAIRAGEGRALEILSDLERLPPDEREPAGLSSPRAQLYARARAALDGTAPLLAPGDASWWAPAEASHASALAALRAALDSETFEIGELTFARGLRPADVGFVVQLSVEEVERRLGEIESSARRLIGDEPRSTSGTLEGALLEAFSLDAAGHRRPNAPLFELGAIIAGRYRLDAHLGTGSSADVYRATDLQVPNHVVALKVFRRLTVQPATRELAMRELRLIASVSHPSVVQFKDYGWHAGHTFFVMPFYRGETLRERLARGPLGRLEAKTIFVPLARALANLHRTGVRHQDIKPENIFLARQHEDDGDDVVPILIDLGVAATDAESVLAGTPNYFAPEIAARFAHDPDPPMVTGKADVFSLALVLRNALEPEAAEGVIGGAVEAFVRHRARRAPAPPRRRELVFLRSAFERWLHVAPDARPTAEAFARELSLLTLPEERRARTIGTLRWLVPVTVALAGIFAAVVLGLSRENALQRLEATRARALAEAERTRAQEANDLAASVRDDLARANAASRALKEDVVRLEEEYRSSRLTRQELAARLASADGALTALSKQREEELGRLQQTSTERDEVRAALDAARANLSKERQRTADLGQRLGDAESDVEAARRAGADLRARLLELEVSSSALRVLLVQRPECFMPLKRGPERVGGTAAAPAAPLPASGGSSAPAR